jgi:peptidoglycan/xylan/chitin deacetylase (PgdA/CDA1 family)
VRLIPWVQIVPVLLYHSVDDDPPRRDRRYAVSRAAFEAHADAVSASGRTPLSITEVAAAMRGERLLPHRPVAVTFDDGYANTYEAVVALLSRDVSSTVFVTAGEVGTPDRLSPAQLYDLAQMPSVEVGAHAFNHRRLDELRDPELAAEVRLSKATLEDLTQVEIRSFAYPHGAYDQRARQAVIDAGYSSAAAVKNALSHPADDVFAIARWTVTAKTSASRVAQVLEAVDVPEAWPQERWRTRVYRSVRRQRRRLTTRPARCL